MPSKRLFGTAEIRANGKELLTVTGATLQIGGPNRTTVKGAKVHGFSQAEDEAKLECEISLRTGDSVADFVAIEDGTIYFKADTGQQWVMRNAWYEGEPPTITEGRDGGKAKLTFASPPAEELL